MWVKKCVKMHVLLFENLKHMFKHMYQTDPNVLNFEIISLLGVQPITCSQQTRLRQTLPITKNDYFISEIDISSSECNIYIHFKQTKLNTKI